MSNEFPPPGGQQPQPGDPQGQPQPAQPYGAPQGQPYPSYGTQDATQPAYGQQAPGQGGYYAPAPVVRPPSIDKAVLMMKIGAALSVLSGLMVFAMKGTMREATEKALRDQGQTLTASEIDAAVNISLGVGVFMGLVGAALWWWMAVMNGKGRSWARIVATVFFVIGLLQTLWAFTQPSGGALGWVLNIASLLVGAAAVFFMWQKDSTRFYEESSRTA